MVAKEPYPNFPLSDKDVLYYDEFIRKNRGRYSSMVKFFENAFERPIETPVRMWNNKKHPFYPVYALHDMRLPEHKTCSACGKKGHSANSKKCPLFKSKKIPCPPHIGVVCDDYQTCYFHAKYPHRKPKRAKPTPQPKPKPKRETAAYLQWIKEEKLRRSMIKRLEHLMMMLNDLSIEFEEYYTDKFRISWTPDGRIEQSWTTKGPYDGSWRNEDETKAEIQRILNKFPNSVAYWGIKATGDGISVAHLDKAKRSPAPQQYEAESKNAEQEDYFVFADGTTKIDAEDGDNAIFLRWKIPYSQIRDYVNEWTDNLKSDQEWREGDGPYHVAYEFAHGNSQFIIPFGEEYLPPYGIDWAKEIEDAIISRLRTYDGFPTSVTYDLDEPMTKAEIRSFLTGIPSWKLTKRAESNPYATLGCAGKCPRCEGLVSMKPHGQYCEHCKARGIITYLIDMGDGRLKYDAESKKLPPVEKAIDSGIASGATMEGLDLALGAEDTEHPSVYWFVKGEIMERQREQGKVTENDLAEMVEIVATKAPLWMIDKGMREAERLGDRGPWEILKMAAINRIILEDMDDDSVFSERLGEYRAEEVVMIECPHCYEFGDGEIPADIHYDPGDRWEPPSLDVNSWETCEWCEGKGEVTEEEAEGIPAWDWDILEPDEPHYDRYDAERNESDICDICDEAEVLSEDDGYLCGKCGALSCHACGSGDPDEHPYCMPCIYQREKDAGEWPDDRWDAETNGDKQLELALKRTQMSALRTGLSVLTFGIVILSTFTGWNFWTNKKQEQQISDIMGLV